jgi:hypothetical protein
MCTNTLGAATAITAFILREHLKVFEHEVGHLGSGVRVVDDHSCDGDCATDYANEFFGFHPFEIN